MKALVGEERTYRPLVLLVRGVDEPEVLKPGLQAFERQRLEQCDVLSLAEELPVPLLLGLVLEAFGNVGLAHIVVALARAAEPSRHPRVDTMEGAW